MRMIAAVLLLAGLALPAGGPIGFHYWPTSQLHSFAKTLAPRAGAQKVATESLGAHGNYSFLAIYRSGSGEAEWHENVADIMVFQTGTGTVVVGGEIENPRTTEAHEKRGTGIRGGTEVKVGPGDIVTVPPATPHQVKLEPGTQITYFAAKVTQ